MDRRAWWRRGAWVGAVLALDLAVGAAVGHALVAHPRSVTLDSGHSDTALFVWWLRWAPFSLGHGLNPLYTHYWNAPTGIDAMWNTSILAVGILLVPVTLLLGAVAAFNAATILGPALAAFTATIWLRRHASTPAAAIGGLVFGYSPFVIQEANGTHLHLTWMVLVPLMVMLVEDIGWRRDRPWTRAGPWLGLAAAVQWFVSAEMLLIAGIACAVGLLALAAGRRDVARVRWRPAALAFGVAGAVAALLLAGPVLEQYTPSHVIHGPLQPMNRWQTRLAFLVSPPGTLRFHTASSAATAFRHVGYENGMYVGVPLLLLLVGAVAWMRRRPGVVAAAVVIVVLFVLSLGGAGPWRLVEDAVAPLQSLLPLRFAALMWLAIAFILALLFDAVAALDRPAVRAAGLAGAALCLLPLLPAGLTRVGPIEPVPSFFTSSQVDVLPQGTNALVVPMPLNEYDAGFIWQAAADMRFAQPASIALRPFGPHRRATFFPQADDLVHWFAVDGPTAYFAGPATPADTLAIRRDLTRAGVSVVLLVPSSARPGQYDVVRAVFDRGPDLSEGGVDLWWVTPPAGHSLR
ncbi:MAG TPA: hypothetical protein VKI19_00285 [Acidimicrobiales bacterium]|nr:hypothetical protein [Acidimicrobiales bacterium]